MAKQNPTADDPQMDYDPSRHPRSQRHSSIARRPGFVGLLFAVLGIVTVLGAFLASETNLQVASPPATPVVSKPTMDLAEPTVSIANPIGRQAQEWGVSACLQRVAALSDFLTTDSDFRWLAARGSGASEEESFVATIATKQRVSGLQGVSVLHAAPIGNGLCNTSYSSTIYFPSPCLQTHASVFRAFSNQINLGSDFAEAYATGDGSSRLFLFQVGDGGCVAVTSEAFY